MKNMAKFFSYFVVFLGVCLGVYLGGWVCFMGGIVDVIEAIRADVLDSMAIAFGILKVIFANFVFVACLTLGLIAGIVVEKKAE